ncbi:MAG TPA: YfhO family protein [Syntrophorhabdales bacterium]|nr:YfhO family protein [Syntrophorhabdales bacterium]
MPILPVLLLLVLTVAYFYPVLSGGTVFVERDLGIYFVPPRFLWVKLAKSFTLPLWNPHNYSGIPLLATLQPGVLYPPHILYFVAPFPVAFDFLIMAHHLLAGLTTYLLLRFLNASREAGFTGAATFMLSGYLLSLVSLPTHLFAVSWLPLVMLSFLKFLDRARTRHLVACAIFLSMEFLAGAPEIAIVTVLALVLTALFAPSAGDLKISRFKTLSALALVGLLFLLLSAVQLIPFLELESLSIRRGGLSGREAALWSFGFRDFIQFFVDDAFGAFRNLERYWQNQAWLKTIYMGAVPFALSLFYFLSRDRRRLLLLSFMMLSCGLALGGNIPLFPYLHRVPPFDAIRYPVKFISLFVLLLSVTAGLGLDRLKAGIEGENRTTRVAVRILFFAGFFLALLWGFMSIFHGQAYRILDAGGFRPTSYNAIEDNLHNIRRFLFFSFLSGTLLLVSLRTGRTRVLYGLICLLVADLFLANFGYYQTTQWRTYVSPPTLAETLSQGTPPDRYYLTAEADKEFYGFPYNRAAVAPAYAAVFGLYTIGGSEVMKVAFQNAFCDLIRNLPSFDSAARFLGAAGVRYVISLRQTQDPRFRLAQSISAQTVRVAGQTETFKLYLYEYKGYPGRIFLAGAARFLPTDGEIAKALARRGANPEKELILYGAKGSVAGQGPVRGQAWLVSYKPNRVEAGYEADSGCLLYLSDTYYPGWRAYVDGRQTPIYRANLAFRAIEVPKGRHEVVFVYSPRSFYAGLLLTLAGIALCVVLLWRDRVRAA